MLFVFGCFSQTFNYQAAARDNSGSLLQNQNLGVQVSILFGGSTGANLYSESHNVTTNAYGVLDLPIGGGSIISGDFNAIDWSLNSYWVEISMDVSGGTSYTLVGASQLRYVPFAMYAASGTEGPQGPTGAQGISGATGADGVGVVATVDNGNGTFTIFYSDTTSFTTADLTGADGSDGADGSLGVGITSTVDNGNGTFTLNYSDGTNFTTSDLTGPAGVDGETIGIGPAGADGVDGVDGLDGRDGVGITSTVDNGNGTFTLNYSDLTTFTTIDLRGVGGADGEIGATGPAGADGTNGTDGVGITSTVDNGNGTFTLNYSDATTFTTTDLTGADGADGSDGATGATGSDGTNGTNGIDGTNGVDGTAGTDGVGITSTVDNGNGTFTL
ncbi:MAG: hypothetical protein COA88_14925, partial [Kordia sp.]